MYSPRDITTHRKIFNVKNVLKLNSIKKFLSGVSMYLFFFSKVILIFKKKMPTTKSETKYKIIFKM